MKDLPVDVLAITLWSYWTGVGAMVLRMRRKTRTLGGLVPEQTIERRMWVVWVPLVAAWIVLPTLALNHVHPLLAAPAWAQDAPWNALRSAAAAAALVCLALTAWCWRRMGLNWSMGVSVSRKTELITDGLFSHVRHPIYALSIVLMLCSLVILPTLPMLVIALAHVTLMHMKARNEERHLLRAHGAAYQDYLERTGRFWPRLGLRRG